MKELAKRAGVELPPSDTAWELALLHAAKDTAESELVRALLRKIVSPAMLELEQIRKEGQEIAVRLPVLMKECLEFHQLNKSKPDAEYEALLRVWTAERGLLDEES